MRVSIVIPTYNHCEDCLRPCLESLLQYTPCEDVEIIISANGCTDGTRAYLDGISHLPAIKVVWNDSALGYTKATNDGVKASTGKYVILLNNDTVLLKPTNNDRYDWLNKLLKAFDDPTIGVAGPMKAFSPEANRNFIIFFCVCIRRHLFETIGLLDECFSPGFGEDTDFCVRAEMAGYKVVQVPDDNARNYSDAEHQRMVGDFPIYHRGEATFKEVPNADGILSERRGMLRLRYNQEIFKLNLGCGDLKFPDYENIDLYNPNADVKLDVRDLSHYATGTVDEIMALHVLEHISPYEVEKTLKEWGRCLKQGGKLVIEMPDIEQLCKHFSESKDKDERYRLLNCIYGTTQIQHPHLFGWYPETMTDFLRAAGFVKVQVEEPTFKDHWGYNMRLVAHKPQSRVSLTAPQIEMLPPLQIEVLPEPEVKALDTLPNGTLTDENIRQYRYLIESLPSGAVIADLGVNKGQSVCAIADIIKGKNLKVYAVDSFATADAVEREFVYNLTKFGIQKNVKVISRSTHDAAKMVDEPLDLVFIDADPAYDQVKLDIIDWGMAKVKDGGIIAGHNYAGNYPSIMKAVNELFGNHYDCINDIWSLHKGQKKRRVYDCFPFNNELDILEIRLNELYPVVDKFVLVEARKRHSGIPKPLYFEDHKERFKQFHDKIVHIVVEDFPEGDAWVAENYQRAAIRRGLKNCVDDDVIIVSDADEIPSASAVSQYQVSDGVRSLGQKLHYYYLNYRDGDWNHGKIFPYKTLKEMNFEQIRRADVPVISNGGWHFSFLGDIEHIVKKIESFADQQLNVPEFKNREHIEKCLETGADLFNRAEYQFNHIDVDDTFPKFVQNNKDVFSRKGLLKLSGQSPVVKPEIVVKSNMTVTCEIATKDRYDTTLPAAIMSVIHQSHRPNKLIILDDGEHRDPRNMPHFQHMFNLLSQKGIEWEWLWAPHKGQTLCHQMALEKAKTDLIWRLDDDDSAEPDVLGKLVALIAQPDVGAASGRVLIPGCQSVPERLGSGKIEDINSKHNIQWCDFTGIREVDHFNNTFLYRKEVATHGFRTDLSPAGHREETFFTYGIKRNGFKLLVDSSAVVWHMRENTGGIRAHQNVEYWQEDEVKFMQQLAEWKIRLSDYRLFILNNGMGDHFAFKTILPDIRQHCKQSKIRLAVCYPEVFEDQTDIELMSISDATYVEPNQDKHNVYKWGSDNKWKGRLTDAYRRMFLI